jgi:transposase
MERIHMNHLRELIYRLRAGESQRRIAKDLNMSRTTVRDTWTKPVPRRTMPRWQRRGEHLANRRAPRRAWSRIGKSCRRGSNKA